MVARIGVPAMTFRSSRMRWMAGLEIEVRRAGLSSPALSW